jgi:subtilisin-like proprotein convertase family protein
MNLSNFNWKNTLLGVLVFCYGTAFSQLITFTGTGNLPIPPGAPSQTIGVTQSPCTVAGVGIIGGCVTIENVTINLTHTWVGDIGILLIGPGGQVLELSTGNGGGGDNYTNTVFSDQASNFITSGSPPYTGNFRPEGRVTNLNNPYSNVPPLGTHTFANTYNGLSGDGAWTLHINDYVIADIGELISWSITFNLNGAPPVANAGPDVIRCSGLTTSLTATGGGTYAWSTGTTTASTMVMPVMTTTYTVTVTSPGCGTDTDEVVVTVVPAPSVVLTVTNPDVCAGGCTSVVATFTGTAPFSLTYNTGASPIIQSYSTNVAMFQVCVPVGAPPGNLVVQTTVLTDANCTCQ